MNKIHPTIKFTAEFTSPFKCDIQGPHDCFCHQTQSIPFLDTSVSIRNGIYITDLYRKPTDRCQYLLPSSCHPSHIFKNIPFNLGYRILRICSDRETLEKGLDELKELLISRDYRKEQLRMQFQGFYKFQEKRPWKRLKRRKMNDLFLLSATIQPSPLSAISSKNIGG